MTLNSFDKIEERATMKNDLTENPLTWRRTALNGNWNHGIRIKSLSVIRIFGSSTDFYCAFDFIFLFSADYTFHHSHRFYFSVRCTMSGNTFTCATICSHFYVDFHSMMFISESWMGYVRRAVVTLFSLFDFVLQIQTEQICDVWTKIFLAHAIDRNESHCFWFTDVVVKPRLWSTWIERETKNKHFLFVKFWWKTTIERSNKTMGHVF